MHIRRAQERGHVQHSWLDTYHSFSFAEYYDPNHMGYSVLRVINDDRIAPATGFGMHGHRNMEIITYMIAGELRHTDSLGHTGVIRAGDVQRMSAGSGVRHSEINASSEHEAHLLQIWIVPNKLEVAPEYEDRHLPEAERLNKWYLVASGKPQSGAMVVHQDMMIWTSKIQSGHSISYSLEKGRCLYLHVVKGRLRINGHEVGAGDAVMQEHIGQIALTALEASEVILFDLPGGLTKA